MRGKSPNWLLGDLIPTTYILGGAVRMEAIGLYGCRIVFDSLGK